VVACLEEVDEVMPDSIDQAVPSCDSPGPNVGSQMPQGFRLPDAAERFASGGLHEIEGAEGNLPVRSDPMLQVLHAFILNDGDSRRLLWGSLALPLLGHFRESSVRDSQLLHQSFEFNGGCLFALGPCKGSEKSSRVLRRPK